MTPHQQKILEHLIDMAKKDKACAWAASKNYAQIDPYELADMPQLLTAEMKKEIA